MATESNLPGMANTLRLLPLRMMKESVESDLIMDAVEDMIETSLLYISRYPPNDLLHSASSDLTLAPALAVKQTIAMFQPLPNWATVSFAPTDYAVLEQANVLRSTGSLNELKMTKRKSTVKFHPQALSATGGTRIGSTKPMILALAFTMILIITVCFKVQNLDMSVVNGVPSREQSKLVTPLVTNQVTKPTKRESHNVGRDEEPEILKGTSKRPSLLTSDMTIPTPVMAQESLFSSGMRNTILATAVKEGNAAKEIVVSEQRERIKHTPSSAGSKTTKAAVVTRPVQNVASAETTIVPASAAVMIQEPSFLSTMTFSKVFIPSSLPLSGADVFIPSSVSLSGAEVQPVAPAVVQTSSQKPVKPVAPFLSTWSTSPPIVASHTSTKIIPASAEVMIHEPPFLSAMALTNVFIPSSVPLSGTVIQPVVPAVVQTSSQKPFRSLAPFLSTWTVSPPIVAPHNLAEPIRIPFLVKLRTAIFKRIRKFLSRFRRTA